MTDFTMTIDGCPATSRHTIDVINPATEEVFATAPSCSEEQLDVAMRSSAAASRAWSSNEDIRREALLAAADRIEQVASEVAPILTAEQGKPLREALGETQRTATWFRYFAELQLEREVIQDDEKAFVQVIRRPVGPVAAITPWNFPLAMAAWKIAPALRAGNTVTVKPSPFTPLSTLRLGEHLRDVFPPGVLNVLSGGDQVGELLTNHPLIRKISFTGSVPTGKSVAAVAARDLKRLTLELGGNDPAIVLDDVDPAVIAERLFWGAFTNNGQVCSAIKRLYVPERLFPDMVDALVAQAESVRVGDGAQEDTQLGPINNAPQLARVSDLVDDAMRVGARAATGGHRIQGPGYFFQPTIVVDASDGMRLVEEEQFGPVLPVIAYRELDDVVEAVNRSEFGLTGSVWGTDLDRAEATAERLDCGTALINAHLAVSPGQPFGGSKSSGLGVENGPWGLYGYTELKVLYRARS